MIGQISFFFPFLSHFVHNNPIRSLIGSFPGIVGHIFREFVAFSAFLPRILNFRHYKNLFGRYRTSLCLFTRKRMTKGKKWSFSKIIIGFEGSECSSFGKVVTKVKIF